VRIGLTGGIGSGKSTVARMWVALGATLVDTDAIAHAITAPGGAAMAAIRDAFGDKAVAADGALDRVHMRELAFSDPLAKRRLEAIVHPVIGLEALRQAQAAEGPVVFDVPLLAESAAWRARCDRILVVDCPEEVQVERVVERSGWQPSQVRTIIAQQASRPRRRGIADAVIHNAGLSLDDLRDQVRDLFRLWVDRAPHDPLSNRPL
jgi:dephospho-CoA kinase